MKVQKDPGGITLRTLLVFAGVLVQYACRDVFVRLSEGGNRCEVRSVTARVVRVDTKAGQASALATRFQK